MDITSMKSMFATRGWNLGNASCSHKKSHNLSIMIASALGMILLLDISQLVFAIAGALCYMVLEASTRVRAKADAGCSAKCKLVDERVRYEPPPDAGIRRPRRRHTGAETAHPVVSGKDQERRVRGHVEDPMQKSQGGAAALSPVIKPDAYQPSFAPVLAPKFQSIGFEAEVCELVPQILPDLDEARVAKQLALHVKRSIQSCFPRVDVTGIAQGSLKCGKAFGVAVPELDIVANISPAILVERLQQRTRADTQMLHVIKSALRACTDRLVSAGGLKFRRSAFRGEEPRVTLLVPSSLGFFPEPIAIDFSVNAVTPLYTAALLSECGRIQQRAKALVLFVKRWAKDRGVCHGAKGHLSPYQWSLLVIYFLQVGVQKEGPLLPALADFTSSLSLALASSCRSPLTSLISSEQPSADAGKLSIAELFHQFVTFYNEHFNWHHEAISIRQGRRAPPANTMPLNVLVCERGNTVLGPVIEDPFKAGSNLGMCMNVVSLARLREELSRACKLCLCGASLTEMLQPWAPAADSAEPITSSSCEHTTSSSSMGEDN